MNRTQKWRKANPEKTRAHWMVQCHLRNGRLIKQPCECCGETKVQAHHDDYSKPLDIRWLCIKCHEDVHHGIERHIKASLPKRSVGGQPKPNPLIDTAKSLRKSGKTYQEIANQLGYSKSQIYKWINNTEYD